MVEHVSACLMQFPTPEHTLAASPSHFYELEAIPDKPTQSLTSKTEV